MLEEEPKISNTSRQICRGWDNATFHPILQHLLPLPSPLGPPQWADRTKEVVFWAATRLRKPQEAFPYTSVMFSAGIYLFVSEK